MASLILFLPALHQGYLDLIEKYDAVYLLDDSVLRNLSRFQYLERDLRRFDPLVAKRAIQALYPEKEVVVANEVTLCSIDGDIALPEDEISEELKERFLKGKTVTSVPVFLRWNKTITLKETEPHPERVISTDECDRENMGIAAALSGKSSDWWRQIGAVVVKDGAIVTEAHNKRLPTEYTQDAYGDPRSNFDAGESIELASTIHAEAHAIAHAAKKGVPLDGASMYVTTYPCPVCAKSIAMSGIKKLYYRDGYSLFDAEKILNTFGVEVIQVKGD